MWTCWTKQDRSWTMGTEGEKTPAPKPPGPPPIPLSWIRAAQRGCSQCLGPVRVPPAGAPFSQGPHMGRYLCIECWTLVWNEHPEHLADEDTKKYVAEEARVIRLKRQASVLYQDGKCRVYVSTRGTLVFDLAADSDHPPHEFDPDRFLMLIRAVEAVRGKLPAAFLVDAPIPIEKP